MPRPLLPERMKNDALANHIPFLPHRVFKIITNQSRQNYRRSLGYGVIASVRKFK